MKSPCILVLMDFSPKSFEALPTAFSLAKTLGLRVCVLHIVETSFFSGKPEIGKIRNALLAELLQAVPTFAQEDFVCVAGAFSPTLEQQIQLLQPALVALSQNGERWALETFLMGSHVKSIVRTTKVPTLVLKTYRPAPYGHLMIPSDLSPQSKEHIMQMVSLFPHARFSVVYIYAELSQKNGTIYGLTDAHAQMLAQEQSEEEGRKAARFFREITPLSPKLTCHVFNKDITPDSLVEISQELEADLVALHTTGNFSFLAFDTLEVYKDDIIVSQK